MRNPLTRETQRVVFVLGQRGNVKDFVNVSCSPDEKVARGKIKCGMVLVAADGTVVASLAALSAMASGQQSMVFTFTREQSAVVRHNVRQYLAQATR